MTNTQASERELRIGTRGSKLARWQAEWVADALRARGERVALIEISTQGDEQTQGPIGKIGAPGVFTKSIQQALAAGDVDLAVHSLKDLPTDPTDGLALAACPLRANVADALVSNVAASIAELAHRARVGTGSLRRAAQLRHVRPDLVIADIRGNVDTRLRKLDDGQFDAIMLAAAGLIRLGWETRITQAISCDVMLPAVGQGALGIECRADDRASRSVVELLDHAPTRQAVTAERTLLAAVAGGCSAPIGAWGRITPDGSLTLTAVVLSGDGQHRIGHEATGAAQEATALGERVASELLDRGAGALIAAARS